MNRAQVTREYESSPSALADARSQIEHLSRLVDRLRDEIKARDAHIARYCRREEFDVRKMPESATVGGI